MELALADSPAAAAGVTVEVLRTKGFVRVGPSVGTAVASGATFLFSKDALAAAGLHPVAEYRPPARTPNATAGTRFASLPSNVFTRSTRRMGTCQ